MTKTRKGVGDRRLAEPCFAMQNAPRSGRTRRGGRWGRESFLPPKGAAPEHRARRRGSARKSDAQTMLGASSPSENARGGCRGWPCLLGRWTPTNECPGCLIFLEPIGSYTRYMSRLQRVLSRSPPKDGDPAPPCPTLPLPPAKKKERPACRRHGEDGRRARGGSMPAVLGGRAPSHRGALARLWRAGMVLISSFC